MSDPSYVRLRSSLTGGMRADLDFPGGSGWSIAGFDVKAFPKDKNEAAFVRSELKAGRLEAAGKAEYDEAHPKGEEDPPEHGEVPHQEGAVMAAAAEQRAALEAAREGTEPSESEGSDEPKPKKKAAKKSAAEKKAAKSK